MRILGGRNGEETDSDAMTNFTNFHPRFTRNASTTLNSGGTPGDSPTGITVDMSRLSGADERAKGSSTFTAGDVMSSPGPPNHGYA